MVGKKKNLKEENETGPNFPSYDVELGARIDAVCRLIGTKKDAANIGGISNDMLHRYVRGEVKQPRFRPLVAMCMAAGVSVEWLATGLGEMRKADTPAVPKEPMDEALLEMVVEELERFREGHDLYWSAERKARLIVYGYAMMLAERAEGRRYNADRLRFMWKAAS